MTDEGLPPGTQLDAVAAAFRSRRVLVTGHTGFKGSWLSLWLAELGAEVWGLSLQPSTNPSHFELAGMSAVVHHEVADVRDFSSVQRVFEAARPEVVFHLAAQALVVDSYADPKATFDTNIGGTVNVLEALRQSRTARAAVVITGDKCYENREWEYAYRENDPMGGHDPYSASKGAAELVVTAYRRSFFSGTNLGLASARAGNVIGGGDWSRNRLIPDCVRALTSGGPILLRNPSSVRPWQFVLEPLWGYLLVGSRLLAGDLTVAQAFNFGPNRSPHVSVLEVAEMFAAAWQSGQVETAPTRPDDAHEARTLKLASDKAAALLRWMPLLDAERSVRWTVDWYRDWSENRASVRELSRAQIQAYMASLAEGRGFEVLP